MTAVGRTAAAFLAIAIPVRGFGRCLAFGITNYIMDSTMLIATTTTTNTRTTTGTPPFQIVCAAPSRPIMELSSVANRGACMPTRLFSSGSSSEEGDDSASISSEGAWEETEGDADEGEQEGDEDDEEDADDDESSLDDDNNVLYNDFLKWSKQLSSTVDTLSRKKKSLSSELKKAETVEDTMHRAQSLTSNMYLFTPGVRTAVVQDWEADGTELELTLDDAYDSASAEADALFQQIRKLKRGSAIVKNLLDETAEALLTLEEMELDLNACISLETKTMDENMFRLIQDRLIRTSRKTGFSPPPDNDATSGGSGGKSGSRSQSSDNRTKKPALGTPQSNMRKLMSPGGCLVLVGRNRRGNEYLSFNVARGDDIWMHARGCPGAHVLIQQRRGSPPVTEACIQFAADLAIFYSDARMERSFAVTTAEPKHLQKPRGAPLGAVKLREENKVITGYPDQVLETLKQAREESGQDTETYRFSDKAKHRKKTKETTKQEQAKRKAKVQEKKKRKN